MPQQPLLADGRQPGHRRPATRGAEGGPVDPMVFARLPAEAARSAAGIVPAIGLRAAAA